jgi:MFS family permease
VSTEELGTSLRFRLESTCAAAPAGRGSSHDGMDSSSPGPTRAAVIEARRARLAVSGVFFVNGAVLASWLAHIPAVKAQHGISDGRLGVVLLSMAVGAVLALPAAGWLIARWGGRTMTAVAAAGFCLALPLPVISPSVGLLCITLVLFGACNAMLDVAMNTQAVALEDSYGRPIMSSFHGLFSLGGVAGAVVAAGAMALGFGAVGHVVAVAMVSFATVLGAAGALPPSPPQKGGGALVFARPPAALLCLGVLTFCALLAEGAMGDWSAVYLHDALGTSSATAAIGFAVFSLTMAAGRFGGDHLARRLGPGVVLRGSGTVAAVGLGGALLLGSAPAAIAGFGLVGAGVANAIPILFSSAGRVAGVPAGTALAAVATTGYGGYLTGPPLIGLAADFLGLPVALAIVSVACVVIAAGAGVVPSPGRARRESSAALPLA